MEEKLINLTIRGLTTEQAEEFAQFLKRITFNDYRQHATSNDEAYLMI